VSRLTLGLLPALKSGVQDMVEAGQQALLIGQYFGAYAAGFEHTWYFSYRHEWLEQYTDDAVLLSKVTILPGRASRLYSLVLPIRWRREVRQCDVLRVFQTPGAIPAAIAHLLWGIPVAVTYGYSYAHVARAEGHRWRALLHPALERIVLRTAAAVIVTTPALRAYVERQVPANRVHLIPNSVDTERFAPAPLRPGKRRVAFVGRFERQKNLELLVDAATRIQPAVELVLVGDGSQRETIHSAAAQLGVRVEMPGIVPNAALPAVLQSADAFALPSLVEGHPKALLEAMSCGLPCVGLDVPGTRDVLQHELTGLLCPPTADGLAAGLQRVLDDDPLAQRLGRAARDWVNAHFDSRVVMQQEVTLLRQLAAGHKHG